MKPIRPFCLALLVCHTMAAWAQSPEPTPLAPESFRWFSPPNLPHLRAAWVVGSESAPGVYALRVMLAQGGRIPAHTHPDERVSTVLSGTLYVGFGAEADDERMVAVPAGGVYVAPAHVPHFLWARDGDVIYQESGAGPTATMPVKR